MWTRPGPVARSWRRTWLAPVPARWPGFSAGALEAGIRAIFALPLQVGAVRVGVLDLYRDRSGVLSSDELAEALSFADAAITILLQARAYAAEQPIIVVSRDVLAGVVHFSSDRDGRIRDADRGAR